MGSYKGLTLVNSPYSIEYNAKIAKALNMALEKGLLKEIKINSSIIQNYKFKRSELPLWILEAACKVNEKNWKIPIIYQNVWFCLHNCYVKRKQPSGRLFKSKVSFAPCFIDSNKEIKKLLLKTCQKIGFSQRKFSILCSYKSGTIRTSKDKIPITAILKICQILKLDVWKLLKNSTLYGKTNHEGKVKIPNLEDVELKVILAWLKTEGHSEIGNAHVEINQKNNIESLRKLKKLMVKTFGLKDTPNKFSKGNRGEDRYIISSSPLKQLLCLKYGLPPGYKSGVMQRMELRNLTKRDYRQLLAAFVQTEGCLSRHKTRNKKRYLPRFEFSVKDAALIWDCISTLKRLGFKPKVYDRNKYGMYKLGIYDSNETIRLVNEIRPYVLNNNKIKHLKEICSNDVRL